MKSNKVRMNISRDMHEWFTAIDGKTNDDKMEKLKLCEMKVDTFNKLHIQRGQLLLNATKACNHYQELYYKSRNKNHILKGLLGLSVTVSIISVSYLAYVHGWFV